MELFFKVKAFKDDSEGIVVRDCYVGADVVLEQGSDLIMIDKDHISGLIEALQKFVA